MTRAARQSRNHRRREKLGLVALQVEVHELNLLATLRLAGFIGEYDRDPEHAELARLLEDVIRLWITPPEVR